MKKTRKLIVGTILVVTMVSNVLALDAAPTATTWFGSIVNMVLAAFNGSDTGDCGPIKVCTSCKPDEPRCRP